MDDFNEKKRSYTPRQAKLKAESYCAYQERAQQEVRDKLYDWGLYPDDVELIISELISENFLNEERFAKSFTLGKFRMKGWGKIKIKQHLKSKRISDPLIKLALKEIDLDDYDAKLDEIIEKKRREFSSKLTIEEKAKLIRYIQSKGFESDLIYAKINSRKTN